MTNREKHIYALLYWYLYAIQPPIAKFAVEHNTVNYFIYEYRLEKYTTETQKQLFMRC